MAVAITGAVHLQNLRLHKNPGSKAYLQHTGRKGENEGFYLHTLLDLSISQRHHDPITFSIHVSELPCD